MRTTRIRGVQHLTNMVTDLVISDARAVTRIRGVQHLTDLITSTRTKSDASIWIFTFIKNRRHKKVASYLINDTQRN